MKKTKIAPGLYEYKGLMIERRTRYADFETDLGTWSITEPNGDYWEHNYYTLRDAIQAIDTVDRIGKLFPR